jgi:hypothetical protein
MYRWWEGEGPSEIWFARVELEPGVWESIRLAEYEARTIQPRFWDLPLKEEYFEQLLNENAARLGDTPSKFMPPVIILMMIFGGALFVLLVVGVALTAQFSR